MRLKLYTSEKFTYTSSKPLADIERNLSLLVDLNMKWYNLWGNSNKTYYGEYSNNTFRIYPKYNSWLQGYTMMNRYRGASTYLDGTLYLNGDTVQIDCKIAYDDSLRMARDFVYIIGFIVCLASLFLSFKGMPVALFALLPSLIALVFIPRYHSYLFKRDKKKYEALLNKICN
jgi:hypothetical protein